MSPREPRCSWGALVLPAGVALPVLSVRWLQAGSASDGRQRAAPWPTPAELRDLINQHAVCLVALAQVSGTAGERRALEVTSQANSGRFPSPAPRGQAPGQGWNPRRWGFDHLGLCRRPCRYVPVGFSGGFGTNPSLQPALRVGRRAMSVWCAVFDGELRDICCG
jgi:hypothetical protein